MLPIVSKKILTKSFLVPLLSGKIVHINHEFRMTSMKMKMMVVVILTTTMAIQRSFGWRNRGHLECTSAYLFIFSTKIVGTSDQQNCLCTTISITTTLLYTSFCPDFESNLSLLFSNRCINFDFSFFLPRGMMDKVGDQWTSAAPTCFYAFAISVLSSLSLVPALCSIFLLDSSL